MATRLTSCALCLIAMLFFAGCQQQPVTHLPSPNFDGPRIAALPAPAPQPTPEVKPATPRPVARVDGPREWVPAAKPRAWKWIVIHHSATSTGGAKRFDRMHRDKGWDELGYHFVIGNGSDTADGQVEVGSRWTRQKWGAHAKTPDNQFNDYGIGICLVGNFENGRPTAAQMRSTAKLVAYLMHTYNIPADRVLGHKDTPRATECPGKHLHVSEVRRMANMIIAEAEAAQSHSLAATDELRTPDGR
jgi:N-acetylmuramoyl-L-alanine amidase